MTPADRQSLIRKLGYLQKNLDLLTPYRALSEQELTGTPEKKFAVERLMQTAIESVIDCSRLLVLIEEWRKLRDERDALIVLAEHAVIADDLCERLQRAKGFRNVLVHEYVEVDPHLLYVHLQTGIADLQGYARSLAAWLNLPEQGTV